MCVDTPVTTPLWVSRNAWLVRTRGRRRPQQTRTPPRLMAARLYMFAPISYNAKTNTHTPTYRQWNTSRGVQTLSLGVWSQSADQLVWVAAIDSQGPSARFWLRLAFPRQRGVDKRRGVLFKSAICSQGRSQFFCHFLSICLLKSFPTRSFFF